MQYTSVLLSEWDWRFYHDLKLAGSLYHKFSRTELDR